ncbi:MAG TPA: 16S rRNA (uracil(1498)-N(3))-methyltransferase [Pyrinomonadaceae bacterium]|nr:16S rRNA (uracil(1498)-N(3))-methyltransferase [Pyrinomonadaceae bacterium]
MRRFYAPPENFIQGNDKITLDFEQTRHLRDVLRLRAGESVNVFDGEGKEFSAAIEEIGKRGTRLKIIAETMPRAPESALDLTLAVALLKGEKFDLVLQKAVELGVTRIVPLQTRRADAKLKDAGEIEKKLERWRKIVFEAAKQCGRARLMQIENPQNFEKFIEKFSSTDSTGETRVLFSERGGENFSDLKTAEKFVAVTGAEGGWEDAEIDFARAGGFKIVTLGGRILRAETAAISIAAILQNRFGDLR